MTLKDIAEQIVSYVEQSIQSFNRLAQGSLCTSKLHDAEHGHCGPTRQFAEEVLPANGQSIAVQKQSRSYSAIMMRDQVHATGTEERRHKEKRNRVVCERQRHQLSAHRRRPERGRSAKFGVAPKLLGHTHILTQLSSLIDMYDNYRFLSLKDMTCVMTRNVICDCFVADCGTNPKQDRVRNGMVGRTLNIQEGDFKLEETETGG